MAESGTKRWVKRMLYGLTTVSKWLDRLVAVVVFVLLIGMIITMSAAVFWRYCLNNALSWSEELAQFLLIWLSFLGAALATYRGSHIGISFVFDLFAPRIQVWVERAVNIIILIFMGSIFVNGIRILPVVSIRVAPTLQIPMNMPYLILPISSAIIMFQIFVHMLIGSEIQHPEP
jgi:TRAP-type C4-dicarboxylate transport system permease small subunit